MSKQRKAVKLEEKVLEFEFEINQVQFNKTGTYFLKLSIENFHRRDLLSQVLVDVNNSGNNVRAHSAKTDAVLWDGSKQFVQFSRKKFKFRLPKGFCKNDLNYDVYLMIEASLQRINKRPEHVGDARVAIYPRTDAPKANLAVKRGREYYHYSSALTLLRPTSRPTLSMHCGRLSYAIAFREFVGFDRLLRSETSDEDSELIDESKPPSRIRQSTFVKPNSPPTMSPLASKPAQNKPPQRPHSPPTRLQPSVSPPPAPMPSNLHPGGATEAQILPPSRIPKPSNFVSAQIPQAPLPTEATKLSPDAAPPPPSIPTSAVIATRARPRKEAVKRHANSRNADVQLSTSIPQRSLTDEADDVYKSYLNSTNDDVISPQLVPAPSTAPQRLDSDGSFHLSLPDTPLPLEPPTYREQPWDLFADSSQLLIAS